MKKLAIISIISVFLLVGCDWLQAPVEIPPADDLVVEDPIVDDPILEEDPLLEEDPDLTAPAVEEPAVEEPVPEEPAPEEAAASSESAEVILAKCLTENGAKLYTASWCGHCQDQKEAFTDGLEYLDNTECAEGEVWAQACKDANVTSVPTWIFADGIKQSGNTPLAQLAELAGCTY